MQFTQKVSLEFLPDESREFLQLFRDCKKLLSSNNFCAPNNEPKYVNDLKARCIISGNRDKPISKKIFNKLRADGKIETYHPSEGRTAYSVDQLYQYIESTKKMFQNEKHACFKRACFKEFEVS